VTAASQADPRQQTHQPDLAALARRARDGDRAALERLLVAVQDDVHRLALRMTGCPDDALDATQEILVRVMTRLSTYRGEAAFRTWVHRVAVNHLLDRKRSAVERLELSFGAFADDLLDGLTPVASNARPELDVLAREVKHVCTLALLTCVDRRLRVVYVLGEVFGVSSSEGAWICDTTETAYRKRLSRARALVRSFVADHCGLVAPATARCHCRKRVPAALARGRVDAATAEQPTAMAVDAAVAEMESLYDAAGLIRSLPTRPPPVRWRWRSGRWCSPTAVSCSRRPPSPESPGPGGGDRGEHSAVDDDVGAGDAAGGR
jgi:RNA polymerase sigma factor (sigma-70 family)